MIEKVFEKITKPYGQRWRAGRGIDQYDDQYIGMWLTFIRQVLKSQKRVHGPKGPIYCDVVLSPIFNAFATTSQGYEMIAIFSGAVSHIIAAHHCFLSDPEALPEIGNPLDENLAPDALDLFKNYHPLTSPHHHPKGERFVVATCLAWLACVFVVLHEVGHIVRCHTSYIQCTYGLSIYEELPMLNSHQPKIDLVRAFEWEADEYAAVTSYQLTDHLIRAGNFKALEPLGLDFAWGLATSMIFLIIGRLEGTWTNDSSTHPSALTRYVMSMLAVERARECRPLHPQTKSLLAGFTEAANWFERNKILVAAVEGNELGSLDEGAQKLQNQHRAVKAALGENYEILEELVKSRSTSAERWLRAQSK